jgi:hypothetical protein
MVVCHHNMSIASEASLFTDLVNSTEVRECCQRHQLNVVLHGHQHKGFLTTEDRHGGGPRLHTIGTGALGSCDADLSFQEIVIDCGSPDAEKPKARALTVQGYRCTTVNTGNPRWLADDAKVTIEVDVLKKSARAVA